MYYYIQVTISLFSILLFHGSIKQSLRLKFSTFLQINFGKFTMFSHITNCSFAWIKKHSNNCLNWFCLRLTNIFSTQETQINSVWFYRLMGSCNYLIIIAIEGASIWRLSPILLRMVQRTSLTKWNEEFYIEADLSWILTFSAKFYISRKTDKSAQGLILLLFDFNRVGFPILMQEINMH